MALWVRGRWAHGRGRHHGDTADQRSALRRQVMATRESVRQGGSLQTQPAPETIISTAAAKFLAVFRVVLGFEFLWAFLDKTFGFGYATPAERAWINGGSPTKGFLSRVAVGPFQDTFHAWA